MVRLMMIDREIRAGRFPNAARMAKLLETSPRTIQRDFEFLRDSLQAPLEWSAPDNGYRYTEPSFFLPVQQLTEGELLAVLVADKALNEFRGTPFEGRLRSIFEKLTLALPDEVTVSPRELAHAFSFQWTAPVPTDAKIFCSLQQGIRDAETLAVLYHTQSRGTTAWREIDPFHLANVDGEWYLLAWCHRNREIRVFRPSRIRQCKGTGRHFEPPADFDPAHFLRTKFHAMAGDRPVEVRIRFDPALAGYVTEREWGPAARVQYLTDGGIELGLTSENADAIVRWVLNWGPGAEILGPPWVRRRVRSMLAKLRARYEGQPSRRRSSVRPSRTAGRVYKPPSVKARVR